MRLLQILKQKAKQLKAEARVLMIAYKDRRTPLAAKLLIGITVGYLLSPIDLIPDFIPVLGLLDDLLIVPSLIALSIKLIPQVVLADARQAALNDPKIFKKNNWAVAVVIIFLWMMALLLTYRFFSHKMRSK